MTARSVPRQFREGLKQNLPSPTDKNIKIPQPNLKTIPAADLNQCKKKYTNAENKSIADGAQEDYQNYRRMKVTTSAWGKEKEEIPKAKSEETLNIIFDSKHDIHNKSDKKYRLSLSTVESQKIPNNS